LQVIIQFCCASLILAIRCKYLVGIHTEPKPAAAVQLFKNCIYNIWLPPYSQICCNNNNNKTLVS